ncbi:putative serine/threonine-protein kinase drkA [Oculina patagonica]
MLSSQSRQEELQTKENSIREQQRLLEEERQQKTTLEARLRNREYQIDEERNRHLSTVLELGSALSAAQEELTEYEGRQQQRHAQNVTTSAAAPSRPASVCQTRDWIIQREEVLLSDSVLGNGAWGNVRAGTLRSCQVAVKQIHELILSDHNRRLFEREMSIASCCRHPNLLQFIGATNDDGSPLFVTELLDTSLRHLLSQRALNQEEIVNIALDVAKGLNYLHLSRPLIIHRDVSSANVLLWRRDECWRAKLSDFGSANFQRQCTTVQPGAIIYSAPEALTLARSFQFL